MWPSFRQLGSPGGWVFQLRLLGCFCKVEDGEVVLLCEFQSFPCTGPADDSWFVWGIGIDGPNNMRNYTRKGRRAAVRWDLREERCPSLFFFFFFFLLEKSRTTSFSCGPPASAWELQYAAPCRTSHRAVALAAASWVPAVHAYSSCMP